MPRTLSELFDAYRTARYEVDSGDGKIVLRHGERCRPLEALLDPASPEWAFITAWNPRSEELAPEENQRRQQRLLGELGQRFRIMPGAGVGDGWSEESVLVLGIARAEALLLGRRFGQLAILAGRLGEAAAVVACEEDARE
jgi:Protein of unknown function (DUF3293)